MTHAAVRLRTAILAVALSAGMLFAGRPASAASSKENTWRLATYVLGAGTAYAVAKNKDTLALLGAAGTYLSYRQWKGQVNRRHDRRHARSHALRHSRR